MTVLPSPIPHPLAFRPFDAPRSAFEMLERIVGHDWPVGDENATWDVADGWYEVARALAGPQEAAFAAAARIDGAAFHEVWQRVAGDPSAPLNALVQIAGELGSLLERCGREIEAAKLAAWIEIGEFLIELTGFSITPALTSGASAVAGEGLVLAARMALLRIFVRLAERLGPPRSAGTTTRRLFPPSDNRHSGGGISAEAVLRHSYEPAAVVPSEVTRRISRPEASVSPAAQSATPLQRHAPETRRDFLVAVADEIREKIRVLNRLAYRELVGGSPERGEELRDHVVELRALLIETEAEIGASGPPPGSEAASRVAGGHQRAPDEAMPASRLADPRSGEWFRLLNAGGPSADPARGLNSLEAVLALFETYLHGRRSVAAPRPLDPAADPNRPLGLESVDLRRVEEATGSTFQNLCPFLGGADPAAARPAFDAAVLNLANHLHNSGHGAFAFIITDLEGGGCHAWAAVNQGGTILFLDPQVGRVTEDVPLYGHRGAPASGNVISMDALVVDGDARPAPLPYHGPGQWSTSSS